MRKSVRYALLPLLILPLLASFASGCNERDSESEQPVAGEERVPQRIVSMSPNLTQIIFALDADELLVGVDEYSVYPPEAADIQSVGNYLDPDLETLIAAQPDLVLVVDTDEHMRDTLSGLGLEYMEFGNDTVDDVLESIVTLGRILGHEEEAERLIDEFEDARTTIAERLRGAEAVSVALIVGRNPGRLQDIYVASGGNFLGELVGMAGGRNVFADQSIPWPQVGIEALVGADPDVIIDSTLAKGATDAEYEALREDWNALPSLRAVQTDRIIVPRDGWFQIPGAYLGVTLRLVAHWLHPEVFPEVVDDPNE